MKNCDECPLPDACDMESGWCHKAKESAAPPVALHRLVRNLLYYWCSHWKWARRMHGGKWEEWWADPCCSYVWLRVDGFHAPGTRPGGCAICDRDPKPRRREDYSANAGVLAHADENQSDQ